MKKLAAVLLAVILMALSACGTLQINIVNQKAGTPTGSALPEATQAALRSATAAIPSATPTEAAFVATPTAILSPTPQPTLALNLRLEPGERLSIHYTRMLTTSNGWGIGHGQASIMDHVLRTSDGGQTWTEVTPPSLLGQTTMVYNVAIAYFADLQQGWVMYLTQDPSSENARSVVWTTRDGGQTWSEGELLNYNNLPQEQVEPAALGFTDATHGWVLVHLGASMGQDFIAIFITENGGTSWQRVVDPGLNNLGMGCVKTGLAFTSPELGWVTGSCGGAQPGVFFFTTPDKGATWQPVNLPAPDGLPDLFTRSENICGAETVAFNTPQTGRVLVRCVLPPPATARTWLYTTRDGGHTWVPYAAPTSYGVFDFINGQIGWWLGAASTDNSLGLTLFSTRDAGLTWTPVLNPGWSGPVNFVDAQNGWVVAQAGNRTALVTTANGGKTWKEIRPVVAQ